MGLTRGRGGIDCSDSTTLKKHGDFKIGFGRKALSIYNGSSVKEGVMLGIKTDIWFSDLNKGAKQGSVQTGTHCGKKQLRESTQDAWEGSRRRRKKGRRERWRKSG